MILLLALAHAGEPTAAAVPGRGVEASVSVRLSPEEVKARLADPRWVRDVSGTGTEVEIRAKQAGCVVSAFRSPSAIMTVAYTVKQCPTSQGVVVDLVESSDLASYRSEWIVTPEATGSLMTYKIQLSPAFPFPDSLVVGTLRKEVQGMMEAFDRAYGI